MTFKTNKKHKTKLKDFIKKVSGNFIVRSSRDGYAVYVSKTRGPNSLDYFYNMAVTDYYSDIDEDGDAVLIIVIDPWNN